MAEYTEYTFKINGYTPDTIPMGRLGQYIDALANLIGEQNSVNFVGVVEGSTKIVHRVKDESMQKVSTRLILIQRGAPTEDLKKAEARLNSMLKEDNTSGSYNTSDGAEIIQFPGVKVFVPETYGPITQFGTIDGIVQKVGGKDKTVPIWLEGRDGVAIKCNATREMAKDLAKHLFAEEIRCVGTGKWMRGSDELWRLELFDISNFEVLEVETLIETTAALRAIEGSGWSKIANPWQELGNLCGEGDEV